MAPLIALPLNTKPLTSNTNHLQGGDIFGEHLLGARFLQGGSGKACKRKLEAKLETSKLQALSLLQLSLGASGLRGSKVLEFRVQELRGLEFGAQGFRAQCFRAQGFRALGLLCSSLGLFASKMGKCTSRPFAEILTLMVCIRDTTSRITG